MKGNYTQANTGVTLLIPQANIVVALLIPQVTEILDWCILKTNNNKRTTNK